MSENLNTETGFRLDLMNAAETQITVRYNGTVGGDNWNAELKIGNVSGGHFYRTSFFCGSYSKVIQKAADKAKSFRIENQPPKDSP